MIIIFIQKSNKHFLIPTGLQPVHTIEKESKIKKITSIISALMTYFEQKYKAVKNCF